MLDIYTIERGERVKFRDSCKKLKYLNFNRDTNTPECLRGMLVDKEKITKDTDFLVLDIILGEWGTVKGFILAVDGVEDAVDGLYFDSSLLEFSSM